MGQSSSTIYSSSENLIPETVGIIQDEVIRQARVLSEIATLSYDDFLKCLKQLNSLSRKVTGEDGKQLLFAVKKGTDSTVLWKGTVKIACVKLDAGAKKIETYRLLNLNQFLKVFRTLQCQFNAAMQSTQNERSPSHTQKLKARSDSALDSASSHSDDSVTSYHESGSDTSDSVKQDEQPIKTPQNKRPNHIKLAATHRVGFTASLILEEVDHVTNDIENNGDKLVECSICMERKPDVLLPCAHAYCMLCIEQWSTSHKTCPFCRETIDSTDDTWIISDIPGSQEINDEICSTLMDLTSSPDLVTEDSCLPQGVYKVYVDSLENVCRRVRVKFNCMEIYRSSKPILASGRDHTISLELFTATLEDVVSTLDNNTKGVQLRVEYLSLEIRRRLINFSRQLGKPCGTSRATIRRHDLGGIFKLY